MAMLIVSSSKYSQIITNHSHLIVTIFHLTMVVELVYIRDGADCSISSNSFLNKMLLRFLLESNIIKVAALALLANGPPRLACILFKAISRSTLNVFFYKGLVYNQILLVIYSLFNHRYSSLTKQLII
jgi:hypothetical protein